MTISDSEQQILERNQALRTWAAGLRTWSRGARESASSERLRARRLVAVGAAARPATATACERLSVPAEMLGEPVLPSLDDVGVDELVAVLVGRHGFRPIGAVRAMRIAVLMAGYPPECESVGAADALDVLDTALHYPG